MAIEAEVAEIFKDAVKKVVGEMVGDTIRRDSTDGSNTWTSRIVLLMLALKGV